MSDEKVIVTVDGTELNVMDLCPERWHLEFYKHWKPQRKAFALERGVLFHKMLQHFYQERMDKEHLGGGGRNRPSDMPNLVAECIALGRVHATNSDNIDSEEYNEDIRVFKEYFQKWQYDGWEIAAVEMIFTKDLFDSPKLKIIYTGIIDLIVRDPRLGLCVVDHKTESRESNPFILNNQFEGYQWMSGMPLIVNKIGYQQAPKMEEPGPGEVFVPRKVKTDQRFRRILMQSSPEALAEWREDTIRTVLDSLEWIKRIDAGKRVRKNRTSCDKWMGGCIFQSVCKEPPDVREHKLTLKFFKGDPWDVMTRDGVRREELVEQETIDGSIQ